MLSWRCPLSCWQPVAVGVVEVEVALLRPINLNLQVQAIRNNNLNHQLHNSLSRVFRFVSVLVIILTV